MITLSRLHLSNGYEHRHLTAIPGVRHHQDKPNQGQQ
jgi:hypothetical protein